MYLNDYRCAVIKACDPKTVDSVFICGDLNGVRLPTNGSIGQGCRAVLIADISSRNEGVVVRVLEEICL
jgi:hypothetical protein